MYGYYYISKQCILIYYIEWKGCFVGRLGNFPICHLNGMWEQLCKIGQAWSEMIALVRSDKYSWV